MPIISTPPLDTAAQIAHFLSVKIGLDSERISPYAVPARKFSLHRIPHGGTYMRGTPLSPLRILVVDDNEDTAFSLAFLFRSWDHEVHIVHDGPSAIEAAREFRADAVVLDIGLPGMDGFEVARRLRSLPECKRLLFVGVSGYGREKDRRRADEAGFDRYLVKPFDPWQLQKLFAVHRASEAVPA
jgi:CheY-like chemotaxis protein